MPGRTDAMRPRPDHGEKSYRGSGKLKGKKAVITPHMKQGSTIINSHMPPRNRGTIINFRSALAYRAIPLQAAYCGAKHAVRGFTNWSVPN